MTTSKIYITKQRLEQLIAQTTQEQDQYPKPLLTALAFLLAILVITILAVLLVIVVIVIILYLLLSWIDVIIGKHIIKRIFK